MIDILVVDDHPAICFALKAILEKNPQFHILTAADGVSAMALLKEKSPALVILDIALAKMDGLEILQRLRRYDSTIKALILTGQSSEIYAERAFRAGASGFLSKDDDIGHISTVCDLILNGYSCFPTFLLDRLNLMPQNCDRPPLEKLSDREITVLRYLAAGLTNKEIATRLLLSNKTISTYKTRLLEKLNIRDIHEMQALLEQTQDPQ